MMVHYYSESTRRDNRVSPALLEATQQYGEKVKELSEKYSTLVFSALEHFRAETAMKDFTKEKNSSGRHELVYLLKQHAGATSFKYQIPIKATDRGRGFTSETDYLILALSAQLPSREFTLHIELHESYREASYVDGYLMAPSNCDCAYEVTKEELTHGTCGALTSRYHDALFTERVMAGIKKFFEDLPTSL